MFYVYTHVVLTCPDLGIEKAMWCEVFPSLSDSAAGVVPAQPEMGSLARHAKGWADIAAGQSREVGAHV